MAFLRDRSVFCIPETVLRRDERYIIGGICMFTASVGFAGAALQLHSMRKFRNRQRRRPSPHPDIIRYLALSDLVACAGVFALAMCLMIMEIPVSKDKQGDYIPPHDTLYAAIGTTIEVITLFAYLASYLWTLSYALDTCFQIYEKECSMLVYHILAWAIPLELVIIIETYNWAMFPHSCEGYQGRVSRVLLSYVPIMVVMIMNPIIFMVTYGKIKQRRRLGCFTDEERKALRACRRRFFWMVAIFAVCWLPNIFSISYFCLSPHKTKSTAELKILRKFWYFEAFLNPLQGIFNYFLYRRAFRVTATDTRLPRNALPRVRV